MRNRTVKQALVLALPRECVKLQVLGFSTGTLLLCLAAIFYYLA